MCWRNEIYSSFIKKDPKQPNTKEAVDGGAVNEGADDEGAVGEGSVDGEVLIVEGLDGELVDGLFGHYSAHRTQSCSAKDGSCCCKRQEYEQMQNASLWQNCHLLTSLSDTTQLVKVDLWGIVKGRTGFSDSIKPVVVRNA